MIDKKVFLAYLCYFTFLLVLSFLFSQKTSLTKHNKWAIKLGITQVNYQVKDEPLSGGRGLGFS